MSKGGPRPNSGRPKGKKNRETSLRRRIQEFFTEDEIRDLIDTAKKQAREKPELLKFLLEQFFGKAPQRVEMTGEDGQPIQISWED